jgi:hypothetical protein
MMADTTETTTSARRPEPLDCMAEVLHRQRDTARVYLTPRELMDVSASNPLVSVLLAKVKAKRESVCTKDGLIMSLGAGPLLCSDGEAPPEHLNGCLLYTVEFTTSVCNPAVNQEIDTVLSSFNKIGFMCQYFPFADDADDLPAASPPASDDADAVADAERPPPTVGSHTFARYHSKASCIVILVPKALNLTKPDSRELYLQAEAHLQQNDTLKLRMRVRILQKKFDINDKQITAVGVLVPPTSSASSSGAKKKI